MHRCKKLSDLAEEILGTLRGLARSYATGKVLKEGIPVVIAGAPNAGKSTLLNALLDDDKAIVSDIPGTTRDIIEDTAEIDGVLFRFADTAGLRAATDTVEQIGIRKAEERLEKASIVLWLLDISTSDPLRELEEIRKRIATLPEARHILLLNKTDKVSETNVAAELAAQARSQVDSLQSAQEAGFEKIFQATGFEKIFSVSAFTGKGIEELKRAMVEISYGDYNPESDIMLTNGRHYAAILRGIESLERVSHALLTGLSADFIAQDIRQSLHHLSLLTGTISTPDLLATIFSRFCIGK